MFCLSVKKVAWYAYICEVNWHYSKCTYTGQKRKLFCYIFTVERYFWLVYQISSLGKSLNQFSMFPPLRLQIIASQYDIKHILLKIIILDSYCYLWIRIYSLLFRCHWKKNVADGFSMYTTPAQLYLAFGNLNVSHTVNSFSQLIGF